MSGSGFTPLDAVRALYEARPYPPVGYLSPFLQRVRWEDRPTLNYRAAYAACFGSTEGAEETPKILVAGCGTFEAVVVALANPRAQLLAVDLSARALARLRWQARCRGLSTRIRIWQGNLEEIPEEEGPFHQIVATGVIHHLPDPARGFLALRKRLAEHGLLRAMVYSYWGRALLYGLKELAALAGADSPKKLRRLVESLPADHPYKIYFHLYSDSASDTGLVDGFLHPCDQPFSALSLGRALAGAGLRAPFFLHGQQGQPRSADSMAAFPGDESPWPRLALLEALGELQENFKFFACREEDTSRFVGPALALEWNEALPRRGPLRSALVDEALAFDRRRSPAELAPEQRQLLQRALFLLPRGPT